MEVLINTKCLEVRRAYIHFIAVKRSTKDDDRGGGLNTESSR